MRWAMLTALAAAAAVVLAAWPADAQTRKRTRTDLERYQVKRSNARLASRPSARITVRRQRSFLDPGTEVEPMSRSYTDYAIPPGYSALSVVSGPSTPAGWQNPKWPLPGRFEYGTSRYLDLW